MRISASMSLMLNNLHDFCHKVHKICIFYNNDRAERSHVCTGSASHPGIWFYFYDIRTENDFSLRFYFSSSFIRSSSSCSSICVLFVQLPNNQCSEPFSLLFTFMLSHHHHHHQDQHLSLACRITFSKSPWTIISWLKCCTIFFPVL